MVGYRVLDIETVVDDRFWDRPKSKFVPTPNPFDPTLSVLTEEQPFPPPQAHRVVAMSWVDLSGDDDKWYTPLESHVLCDWGYGADADFVERKMLERFGEAQSADEACLVTWNGRTFDLPVINLRSFFHRISCEWYYKERDLRYRYTEAGHCDLMDVFSDYGAARSMKLGDVAKLVGLPGKVGEIKGGDVGLIYSCFNPSVEWPKNVPMSYWCTTLEKAKAAVGAYCLLDSMQTAYIFARSRVHKGMVSADYFANVVEPAFREPLERAIKNVQGGSR